MTIAAKTRVVVTGVGIVSPLGNNASSTWDALMAKKSGIATIKSFDASGFPTHIAAEVKNFSIHSVISRKKLLKYSMPYINFGLAAAKEALDDAKIFPTATTASRWALVAGSGLMTTDYNFWVDFQKKYAKNGELDPQQFGETGLSSISPSYYGSTQTNAGVALISELFNIQGYTASIHTACASGGQALGLGLQVLRRGDADVVLAGGYDSMITPFSLAGFSLLGTLSTDNVTPTLASRPFDLTRNGFVLGEGAAFLILEELTRAKYRGAKIYAELAGEGDSLSSYRITDSHPSGDGAIQAIEAALKDANLSPQQVDYINAHGTSTKMNDLSETNAMKSVFKEKAYQIPISSTKSQMGHLISAAGALEGAITVLCIHHGKIPMTANLTKPDPECDLDYVTEGPREKTIGVAMSNSFGFGGTNSSIIFKHPEFPHEEMDARLGKIQNNYSTHQAILREKKSTFATAIPTDDHRVVITGFGAIAATGNNINIIWQKIKSGESGIAPIKQWDATNWQYKIAAELKDYHPREMLKDKKLLKLITRQDVIGLNAAEQAINHSQIMSFRDSLNDFTRFNDRTGVYVASPGVKFCHQYELLPLFKVAADNLQKFGEKLFDCVHPMWLLRILSNNVLAYVGIQYGFKGPNQNIPNHGISGSQAVAEAARAIKNQQMDRAIVVGYETAVEPQGQMYYARMGVLSKTNLRPFNIDHDGTILAEAGAAIMLESLASARAREAKIYGEIIADSFTNEAAGIFPVREDGDGIRRALENILQHTQLKPAQIGMITAHGNGNPVNDTSEAKAITAVFGNHGVPITSFKWSTGHSIAALGVLETILTLKALEENIVPGIATLTKPAADCQSLQISTTHQKPKNNLAITLTRGFGSLNGALLVKAWENDC